MSSSNLLSSSTSRVSLKLKEGLLQVKDPMATKRFLSNKQWHKRYCVVEYFGHDTIISVFGGKNRAKLHQQITLTAVSSIARDVSDLKQFIIHETPQVSHTFMCLDEDSCAQWVEEIEKCLLQVATGAPISSKEFLRIRIADASAASPAPVITPQTLQRSNHSVDSKQSDDEDDDSSPRNQSDDDDDESTDHDSQPPSALVSANTSSSSPPRYTSPVTSAVIPLRRAQTTPMNSASTPRVTAPAQPLNRDAVVGAMHPPRLHQRPYSSTNTSIDTLLHLPQPTPSSLHHKQDSETRDIGRKLRQFSDICSAATRSSPVSLSMSSSIGRPTPSQDQLSVSQLNADSESQMRSTSPHVDNNESNSRLETLQLQISQLEQQRSDRDREIADLRSKNAALVDEVAKASISLQLQSMARTSDIASERLTEENSNLRNELHEVQQECHMIARTLAQTREDLTVALNRHTSLESSFRDLEKENRSAHLSVKEKEALIDDQQKAIQELTLQLEVVRQDSEEIRRRYSSEMQGELGLEMRSLSSLSEQCDILKVENNTLRNSNEDLQEENNSLHNEIVELKETVKKLNSNRLQAINESLRNEVEELKKEQAAADKHISELSSQLRIRWSQLQEERNRAIALEESLAKTQAECSLLTTRIEGLTLQQSEKTRQLSGDLERKTSEASEIQKQIQEYKHRCASLENELLELHDTRSKDRQAHLQSQRELQDSLTLAADRAVKQMAEAKEREDVLRQELQRVNISLRDTQAANSDLNSVRSSLKSKLRKVESALQTETQQLELCRKQLKETENKQSLLQLDIDNEYRSFEKELAQLKEQVTFTTNKLAVKEAELREEQERYRSDISLLKGEISELKSRVSGAVSEKEDTLKRYEDLLQQLSSAKQGHDQYCKKQNSSMRKLQTRHDEVVQQLQKKEEELTQLKKQSNQDTDNYQHVLITMEAEQESLKSELQSIKQCYDDMEILHEKEKKSAAAEYDTLANAFRESQKSLSDAELEIEQLNQIVKSQEVRIASLEKTIKQYESDADMLRTSLEALSRESEAKSDKIVRLDKEVADLHKEITSLLNTCASHKQCIAQLETIAEQVPELLQRIAVLNSEISEGEHVCGDLEAQREAVQRDLQDATERIEELQNELTAEKEAQKQLEQERSISIDLAARCEISEKMYTEQLSDLMHRLEHESARVAECKSELHVKNALLQEVSHLIEKCGYCSSDVVESCRNLTEEVHTFWEWCSAKMAETQESSEVDLFEVFDIVTNENEGLVATALTYCRVVMLSHEKKIALLSDKHNAALEEKYFVEQKAATQNETYLHNAKMLMQELNQRLVEEICRSTIELSLLEVQHEHQLEAMVQQHAVSEQRRMDDINQLRQRNMELERRFEAASVELSTSVAKCESAMNETSQLRSELEQQEESSLRLESEALSLLKLLRTHMPQDAYRKLVAAQRGHSASSHSSCSSSEIEEEPSMESDEIGVVPPIRSDSPVSPLPQLHTSPYQLKHRPTLAQRAASLSSTAPILLSSSSNSEEECNSIASSEEPLLSDDENEVQSYVASSLSTLSTVRRRPNTSLPTRAASVPASRIKGSPASGLQNGSNSISSLRFVNLYQRR